MRVSLQQAAARFDGYEFLAFSLLAKQSAFLQLN